MVPYRPAPSQYEGAEDRELKMELPPGAGVVRIPIEEGVLYAIIVVALTWDWEVVAFALYAVAILSATAGTARNGRYSVQVLPERPAGRRSG